MKPVLRIFCSFFIAAILVVTTAGVCYSQLPEGQHVPLFSLKDVKGKIYDFFLRLGEFEAVKIHYLVPRRYEVMHELLLGVLTSINLCQGTELRVRTED